MKRIIYSSFLLSLHLHLSLLLTNFSLLFFLSVHIIYAKFVLIKVHRSRIILLCILLYFLCSFSFLLIFIENRKRKIKAKNVTESFNIFCILCASLENAEHVLSYSISHIQLCKNPGKKRIGKQSARKNLMFLKCAEFILHALSSAGKFRADNSRPKTS